MVVVVVTVVTAGAVIGADVAGESAVAEVLCTERRAEVVAAIAFCCKSYWNMLERAVN